MELTVIGADTELDMEMVNSSPVELIAVGRSRHLASADVQAQHGRSEPMIDVT